MEEEYEDITKVGTSGLKGLRGLSGVTKDNYRESMQRELDFLRKATPEASSAPFMSQALQDVGLQLAESDYGKSIYDSEIVSPTQLNNLNEVRALNQPWYSQLVNGALKGFTTAGTTFVDGTLGLLYGLIQGAVDAYNVEPGEGLQAFGNAMFNNEISAGLREFTKTMEEILPNYRTQDEIDNPYALRNIFSMNTFADDFLKNMGFTVGAFYSGNAFLSALKATKAAGLMSSASAKVIGSVLSGFNEGRIEAGNMYDDMVSAETQSLEREYKVLYDEIMNEPDNLIVTPEGGAYSSRELKLQQLQESLQKSKENINNRATRAAIADLALNTLYLPLTDMYAYGKLYARGFKPKADLISKTTTRQAIGKGLKIGLSEGIEEGNQAFFSALGTTSFAPDSPDAYYNSLTDTDYQMQSKNLMTSLPEAWRESWGGSDVWKEVGIGFLTGIIGMPTFGKVNNSDYNTYIGRGKTVGLSGGMFGEISRARHLNKEFDKATEDMNAFLNKVDDAERFFVRSQSFTDSMDGWVEADDKFEFENASDNDTFNAIDAFGRTGRISDLRDIVNQDFENISDEELKDIATNTSGEKNEWINPDGTSMADTEEGRMKMREKLSEKRNTILEGINSYEEALEEVRATGNSGLDNDQTRELAWLKWKIGRFEDRFKSVKEDNAEQISDLSKAVNAFLRGRGIGQINENSEEGKTIINNMTVLSSFLDLLNTSKSPLQVSALMKEAEKSNLLKFFDNLGFDLLEGMTGLDSKSFSDLMTNLKDTIRLSDATASFNERYREFMNNPASLIKNREKIDRKKDTVNKTAVNVTLKDKINNTSVSDLVKEMDSGDIDSNQLDSLFTDEDTDFLNNIDDTDISNPNTEGKRKVEEAKKIVQTSSRMDTKLNSLSGEVSQQTIDDAKTLLKASRDVSESEQEMLNTATQAFNDPSLLFDELDPSLQGLTNEQIRDVLEDRIDEAKSLIEELKDIIITENNELQDLPNSSEVTHSLGKEVLEDVGHDGTSKIKTENEVNKDNKSKEEKQRTIAKEKANVNDLFNPVRSTLPAGSLELFNKSLADVLDSIDMLIASKATLSDIGKIVGKTDSYNKLSQLAPDINNYLNNYVILKTTAKPAQSKEEPIEVGTPTVNESEIRTYSINPDINETEVTELYQFWKPTITYLPFGKAYIKGNTTPFYKLARSLKKSNGDSMFTEEQLKRIEAVGEYLDTHGAFNNVDNGVVTITDRNNPPIVRFKIDSTLNDKAGEIVILMTDDQGRIIGDVMSPNDASFNRQLGLPQFVERITKAYENAGSPKEFEYKEESTTVAKNMVGKPLFLADSQEMNTLNAIHNVNGKEIPFMLGIAMSKGPNARILAEAGRTKDQGQSELERSINPPLKAEIGQPFLLLPTSSRINHYMAIPFIMESYSENTKNTSLGKAINSVLSDIPKSDNSNAASIINKLKELISVQEIHINYDGDNVKVTIKPNGVEHQMTIYNGDRNAENIVGQLELGLQGQPFQVSRKYINEDYNGQDYNRMIGEIAKTNLPIGATHTVSDWFTINPIGVKGEMLKAKSPKSIGINTSANMPGIPIIKNGVQLYVDTTTWELSDGKKVYEGPNADKVKAQAFGIYTSQNMEKPYNTQWGFYNPKEDKFIKEQKSTESETITVNTELTPAQLEEKASKAGLLGNKVRQALWQVLTPEQQTLIVNKRGPKQSQWMDILENAFDTTLNTFDETKLKGSVEDLLNNKTMFRLADESTGIWNKDKELNWLNKVLPQLSTDDKLRIEKGLIRVSNSANSSFAFGKFQQGIITISDIAADGTVYHEAFHAVVHTLLNPEEVNILFESAREKWGSIGNVRLEENIAEDFRRYIQLEETPILGSAIKFYRTLKHIVQSLLGNEPYISGLFYNINRGNLSNREYLSNDSTYYREVKGMAPGFKGTVQEFQNIVDSNINNEVLRLSRVDKNNRWGRLRDFWEEQGYIVKGYFDNNNKKWIVTSSKFIGIAEDVGNPSSYQTIRQLHRDNLMYDNLSKEDKDYLKEKGISLEEYNEMTQEEKITLFKCKH